MESPRGLLEVLADEVLRSVCMKLPGAQLVKVGAASSAMHERTQSCTLLWRSICEAFLGDSFVQLQRTCCTDRESTDSAEFYRALFQASWDCSSLRYNHNPCERFIDEFKIMLPEQRREPELECLLARSAHTLETLGDFIVIIGGTSLDPNILPQTALCAGIMNLKKTTLVKPHVAEGSAEPANRLRHASCVVNPDFLPPAPVSGAVLVLGGYSLADRHVGQPRIMEGLSRLTLLQITQADASEIKWYEFEASGAAPDTIYHHQCGSFAKGARVIVFGGDFQPDDVEFESIRNRDPSAAAFVYVLDLSQRIWSRVTTSGAVPSWRSFHVGTTYSGLDLEKNEQFVMFGGTGAHCDPLSADNAAEMNAYGLDLVTLQWRRGESGAFMPQGRLRFCADRVGRHFLVYGGYNRRPGDIPKSQIFIKLNLETLSWGRVAVENQARSHEHVMAACVRAGVIVGGVERGAFGVNWVPKLDIVSFSCQSIGIPENGSGDEDVDSESSSSSEEPAVLVNIPQGDGSAHRVVIPRRVFEALMHAQARMVDAADEAADE